MKTTALLMALAAAAPQSGVCALTTVKDEAAEARGQIVVERKFLAVDARVKKSDLRAARAAEVAYVRIVIKEGEDSPPTKAARTRLNEANAALQSQLTMVGMDERKLAASRLALKIANEKADIARRLTDIDRLQMKLPQDKALVRVDEMKVKKAREIHDTAAFYFDAMDPSAQVADDRLVKANDALDAQRHVTARDQGRMVKDQVIVAGEKTALRHDERESRLASIGNFFHPA